MTEDEFFAALEKTPRDWRFVHGFGAIRLSLSPCNDACPITSIAQKGAERWWDEAATLGLSYRFASAVQMAADNDYFHDPALRARLLRACGLPPEGSAEGAALK